MRVDDTVSDSSIVTSGVPQGSVLGPLLFILYVNDLATNLTNPCFIFADDVKIAGQDLVEDIEAVRKWSKTWDMPLNEAKCHILTTAESTNTLQTGIKAVFSARDLGVIISADFKPADQCLRAAQKARGELFRLCGTISSREAQVLIPLYKSIVRPHLEYCVQAWAPFLRKDMEVLEKVQKLATRMVRGLRMESYERCLQILGLFP